ncbi:MAG: dTDP-fucosamine acetyltransferase [Anaerolineae bacterium]|nr:dTDP-fucosamine acetyltransferase [Anaerolineae bacterium]
MNSSIQKLEWDSNFFGVTIGRITAPKLTETEIDPLLDSARCAGFECLYFEANPNDPRTVTAVERRNFQLVDVRVVLEHPFDDRPAPVPRYPIPADLLVTPPQNGDRAQLVDIAVQIGHTSRFAFDTRLARRCADLYRVWIENSCNGFADAVLVARWADPGEPAGLISCTLREGWGHIQLAGVAAAHRQRGVGTGLVQAALDWTRAEGGHGMQVVTQARNVPAQRLYQQMGFFTRSMTLYYHKWL